MVMRKVRKTPGSCRTGVGVGDRLVVTSLLLITLFLLTTLRDPWVAPPLALVFMIFVVRKRRCLYPSSRASLQAAIDQPRD
ncbi:hypothetical protein [Ferrimicrobium acidiphilum]|uniref:hypothetical protein n=1 Tax=Ferrimicrobium acidiphilum TaxID=121039 RepID=UPI0023EFE251|nr:hypothetical protein [Ferrimicrobium acidiphilum]